MADVSEVLGFLRSDFVRIHDRLDGIETRIVEVVFRLNAVERDLAAMKVDYAATQLRLDHMDRRSASNAGSSRSRREMPPAIR